jgi:PAS domain S-box-containing protein
VCTLPSNQNEYQVDSQQEELEHLRAQVATLEQLLEVYEKETLAKSSKLEKTLTELHEHTQNLSHAESTLGALRSMLNSMGDAVLVVNMEGEFLFLNTPAEELLGIGKTAHSLQEWAQNWQVFLPDKTTSYPLAIFPLVRAIQGEVLDTVEIFLRSQPSSTGNWFSVTARVLSGHNDEVKGGVAVFHNITQLKQTEIALRQSETYSREQNRQLQQALIDLKTLQTQLVQTEKMSSLGQLVAGIAHEINNPVNFIYGNLTHARQYTEDLLHLINLYQRHYSDPHPNIQAEMEAIDLEFLMQDLPRLLNSMKVGSERIQGIVSSLRTFSRMDEAEMKSVDLHEGLESTLMILQNRLKATSDKREIKITRHYANLPLIECYAGQLNQVFMNILDNAIDALDHTRCSRQSTQTTAQIAITTKLEKGQVIVKISDNGPGISPDILPRLFDPFFTTKPIGKGTGMGLSISYQVITEKHGGQLTCQSQVGKGTTFTISIPLKQS